MNTPASKPQPADWLLNPTTFQSPVTLINLEEWSRHLEEVGPTSIFQTAGWLRAICNTYGHTPQCLAVVREGRMTAGLALIRQSNWLIGTRGISTSFSDYCEPIGSGDDLRAVLAAAVDFGRKDGWKSLELRGANVESIASEPSIEYLGHDVDLTGSESGIQERFHPSVRRALRKAESSGLQSVIGTSPVLMGQYYQLHCQTRRRLGVPPQPYRFFEALRTHVLEPGNGFIILAKHPGSGAFVAGSVFLIAHGSACYKFGASDERYMQFRGSNWVMWQAMLECRRRGCNQLSMGRTSLFAEGLRRFKLNYGCQEKSLPYFRLQLPGLTVDKLTDRSEGLPQKVISRLPLWVSQLAGRLLYPRLS